jgi:FkbM family methyltransferase
MLAGGRYEKVFGYGLRLHPLTEFPTYRNLKLPSSALRKAIVRYGDFVQIHSIYSFIEGLPEKPVVVEVGAHHGAYAVLLGKLVQEKNGIVIAIEPNGASFTILESNIEKNNLTATVCCYNDAVMPDAKRYSVRRNGSETYLSEQIDPADVIILAKPLKTILQELQIQHVDLLLIDVEGAELPVLESLDWDATAVSRIFCEMHPYRWNDFGYNGKAMTQFLAKRRLRCFDMYLHEYINFTSMGYIGPTVFFPAEGHDNDAIKKPICVQSGGVKKKPKKQDTHKRRAV